MFGGLVSETLILGILIWLLGILIGIVIMLEVRPLLRLLYKVPVVELADSVNMLLSPFDTFFGKPWVGLVMGIASMCAGVFLVIMFGMHPQPLDITRAIAFGILTFAFIALGTLLTRKSWWELKETSRTRQTGKNYPHHSIV